ncbi:MAG: hypothetical protein VKJ04_03855 [Vampirovibrionales bacterium]|nr:hypothetical protein [Vampirovibrionales bacterium]
MQLVPPAFGSQFSPTFSSRAMDATSLGPNYATDSKSAGGNGASYTPSESQSAGAAPPPAPAPVRFGLNSDFFQSPYFSDIQRTPSHTPAGIALMSVLDKMYDSGWSSSMKAEGGNQGSRLSGKVSGSETFSTGTSKVDRQPTFHLIA